MSDRPETAGEGAASDGLAAGQGASGADPTAYTGLRIAAIELRCLNVAATASFYASAFGCRTIGSRDDRVTLALGKQRLELMAATAPSGVPPAPSNTTAFQHCAIVVADMGRAMDALSRVEGWTAISTDGPEHLPASSGGVTAFKFRDPDGHPLEFLEFPADRLPAHWQHQIATTKGETPCLGIDHSAITVADTERSIGFYRDLGFAVASRQINRGSEQARMDGVADAVVEVTGLTPPGGAPPHLELLCYRSPPVLETGVSAGDPMATRLVLAGGVSTTCDLKDPDGHRLSLETGEAMR